ncbi:MAG: hypothetical protein H6Q50_303, partial [Deltaproteobacteria bacterium]|nr:hypothetical protein [Deltaproteobacteria bacterium]
FGKDSSITTIISHLNFFFIILPNLVCLVFLVYFVFLVRLTTIHSPLITVITPA